MKLPLPSLTPYLLSLYIDNLIYRHEVGMTLFGKLRLSSPVLRMHLFILHVFIAVAVVHALWQWPGLLASSGGILLLSAAPAYHLAFRRAWRSIDRERKRGSLEQLYVSLLTSEELFIGKFFGSLAPALALRRYLILFAMAYCVSLYQISGYIPTVMTGAFVCYVLLNQFMFSVQMGLLAGLKSAAEGRGLFIASITERSYPAFIPHLLAMIRYGIIPLLMTMLAAFGLAVIGQDPALALIVLLLAPFRAGEKLENIQVTAREKLMHRFKRLMTFELKRD